MILLARLASRTCSPSNRAFQIHSDHAKAAHDALGVVIGFAALILAFSLVQEQINVRNLEAQVGTEADNLSQLDRLLVRFGNPGDDALRLSLREYANSITNDEWPEQSKGGASGRTAKAVPRIFGRCLCN